jgi:hypothetical protein
MVRFLLRYVLSDSRPGASVVIAPEFRLAVIGRETCCVA